MIDHVVQVDARHRLHVEEHGDPAGLPLLVLHGGPGTGGSEVLRRAADPAAFRIICPDQRGAGRSTPCGELRDNTLAHLLADLRVLRIHLGIDRWLVTGGSWGATLALLHAVDAPDAVSGLLLRNTFLARPEDIRQFFDGAVRDGAPAWRGWADGAAADGIPLAAFLCHRLAAEAPDTRREVARVWRSWEHQLAGALPEGPLDATALDRLVSRYRVQSHYLAHACWLDDAPLSQRCGRLPEVPVQLLHGRDDRVCPIDGAEGLLRSIGDRGSLRAIHGVGHDAAHPAMLQAQRAALDHFVRFRCFQRSWL